MTKIYYADCLNLSRVRLIQSVIKASPSAFNTQSARALILLGKEHKTFWNSHIPQGLPSEIVEKYRAKLPMFEVSYLDERPAQIRHGFADGD